MTASSCSQHRNSFKGGGKSVSEFIDFHLDLSEAMEQNNEQIKKTIGECPKQFAIYFKLTQEKSKAQGYCEEKQCQA